MFARTMCALALTDNFNAFAASNGTSLIRPAGTFSQGGEGFSFFGKYLRRSFATFHANSRQTYAIYTAGIHIKKRA
jgi:hypothetical protein